MKDSKLAPYIRALGKEYKQGIYMLMARGQKYLSTCKHDKVWQEGDYFEEFGGKACLSCCGGQKVKMWEEKISVRVHCETMTCVKRIYEIPKGIADPVDVSKSILAVMALPGNSEKLLEVRWV